MGSTRAGRLATGAALGSLLLCGLAGASCARELELTGAPPPAEERPVLLGELSGLYSLALDLDVFLDPAEPPFTVRAPLPGLGLIMELAADDGSFDVVTGGLMLGANELPVGGGEAPAPCPGDFAGVDRVLFSGPAGPDGVEEAAAFTHLRSEPDRCVCTAAGTISATRHLSGNGLTLTHEYRVCPGSEPRAALATRACPFDPAISGLYRGTRTAADGGPRPAEVALGFVGSLVYGIRHPDVTEVLQGEFDPATGSSRSLQRTAIPEDCVGADEPGELTVREQEGEVRAELRLTGDDPEELSLARKAGGESVPCELTAATAVELRTAGWKTVVDGQPYLALTISSGASPGVPIFPSAGLIVLAALHAPGDDSWLPPLGEPALGELRARLPDDERGLASILLPLPPLAAGAEQQYELVVLVQPIAFGAAALVAAPACVLDRG